MREKEALLALLHTFNFFSLSLLTLTLIKRGGGVSANKKSVQPSIKAVDQKYSLDFHHTITLSGENPPVLYSFSCGWPFTILRKMNFFSSYPICESDFSFSFHFDRFRITIGWYWSDETAAGSLQAWEWSPDKGDRQNWFAARREIHLERKNIIWTVMSIGTHKLT